MSVCDREMGTEKYRNKEKGQRQKTKIVLLCCALRANVSVSALYKYSFTVYYIALHKEVPSRLFLIPTCIYLSCTFRQQDTSGIGSIGNVYVQTSVRHTCHHIRAKRWVRLPLYTV